MKKNRKPTKTIVLATIVGILLLLVLSIFKQPSQDLPPQYLTHTSQDLKISFEYPRDWYVDDRYRMVLLTNYKTNLNRDDKPSKNQMEIILNEFSYCFKTLDEDLINPACGEGGPTSKNTIISKEPLQTNGGTFYKYIVKQSNGENIILYYLQHDDAILQISKQPDPSQFEKEFNDIVNSITFL